jgi:hypothetical protein
MAAAITRDRVNPRAAGGLRPRLAVCPAVVDSVRAGAGWKAPACARTSAVEKAQSTADATIRAGCGTIKAAEQ